MTKTLMGAFSSGLACAVALGRQTSILMALVLVGITGACRAAPDSSSQPTLTFANAMREFKAGLAVLTSETDAVPVTDPKQEAMGVDGAPRSKNRLGLLASEAEVTLNLSTTLSKEGTLTIGVTPLALLGAVASVSDTWKQTDTRVVGNTITIKFKNIAFQPAGSMATPEGLAALKKELDDLNISIQRHEEQIQAQKDIK